MVAVKEIRQRSQIYYLDKYYEIQDEIMLVHRKNIRSPWSDRVLFLGDGYNPTVTYTHRSVLKNEVVFEYDTDDKTKNYEYINKISSRLRKDNILHSIWFSGNKSYHLSCFIALNSVKNVANLKRNFIFHYTKDMPTPDLRLCADTHLIRCEYGKHERTQHNKILMYESRGYPSICEFPEHIWDLYTKYQQEYVKKDMAKMTKELIDHPGVQFILTTEDFKDCQDGRERALFMLIHLLKVQYTERNDLIAKLQEWYRYSGGYKLKDEDVKNKVIYHWSREYDIGYRFINDLLRDIKREDLIVSPPKDL